MFSSIKDRISNTSKSSTRPIKSISKEMTDIKVSKLSGSTTNLSTSSTLYPSDTHATSNDSYEAFLQNAQENEERRLRSQQAEAQYQRVPWQGGIVRNERDGARDWLKGCGLAKQAPWQGGMVRNERDGARDWLKDCGLAK